MSEPLSRQEIRRDLFQRMQNALECFESIPADERHTGTELQPETG